MNVKSIQFKSGLYERQLQFFVFVIIEYVVTRNTLYNTVPCYMGYDKQ